MNIIDPEYVAPSDLEIGIMIGQSAADNNVRILEGFRIMMVSPDILYVRVARLSDFKWEDIQFQRDHITDVFPNILDLRLIRISKYLYWVYCKENNTLYIQKRNM